MSITIPPFTLEEVTSDPISPEAQSAWVLQTSQPVTGAPIGLLLSLTYATDVFMYQFSYATLEGTIVRTQLA